MAPREQGVGRPKEAEGELARIKASTAGAPEKVNAPWQPYPSTAPERDWEWMILVSH